MARNPNNLLPVDYTSLKKEVIKVNEIPDYDYEDYDLNNPKEFPKYIATIEKICRNSFEYKQYIKFLREHAGMNKCSFMENVSNADNYKIKIEIHHEPLTLFDIVIAVYNKCNALRESLNEFLIAKEVIYNHYKTNIGLIPLAETIHELVHNQYLFVPTDKVFGVYKNFINIYKDFIEPETLENIKTAEEVSKHYNFNDAKKLIETSVLYIDPSGAYKMPSYSAIIAALKAKNLQELTSKSEPTK